MTRFQKFQSRPLSKYKGRILAAYLWMGLGINHAVNQLINPSVDLSMESLSGWVVFLTSMGVPLALAVMEFNWLDEIRGSQELVDE